MNRDEVLDILQAHKTALADRFGVTGLALYGSFARDQATPESDIDILVEFDTAPDWRRYFGAKFHLEDLLARTVDLAAAGEVRPEIRPLRGTGRDLCLTRSARGGSGASTSRTC